MQQPPASGFSDGDPSDRTTHAAVELPPLSPRPARPHPAASPELRAQPRRQKKPPSPPPGPHPTSSSTLSPGSPGSPASPIHHAPSCPPSQHAPHAPPPAQPAPPPPPSAARSRRSLSDRLSGKTQPSRHGPVFAAPLAASPALSSASALSSPTGAFDRAMASPLLASSSAAERAAVSSGTSNAAGPAAALPASGDSGAACDAADGYDGLSDRDRDDRDRQRDRPAPRSAAAAFSAAVAANYADCLAGGDLLDKPPSAAAFSRVAAHRRSPPPRQPARHPWSLSALVLLTTLLGAALLGLILHSLVHRQLDPKGCRMAYMYPTYARLHDFDTEHTRFASKYSLYLYREQGFDDASRLRGIPVLFIPGNAGSYKQVRPIAGEAAQHFHKVVQYDEAALRGGARPLDFFTVDFNEDITAFHGQTLLDQAEYLNEAIRYILSLYLDPRTAEREDHLPDPTSVIVLGHSMGGVVARAMLTRPNYQANSINTILTLSAPHARAPVTFDSEIVKIYDDINTYWRHAYSQQWANNNPLWHVTLVSVAGGGLDTIVPSDYASVESIVPETHGFAVFTTTIPSVWTSMDHQAILWCDQFRRVITRALFDVVNVTRATQTKPRAERLQAFKKHFLTGLEALAEKDLPAKVPSTLLTLDAHHNAIMGQGERLTLRRLGVSPRPQAYLMPIPPLGSPVGKRFTLLTDQRLDEPTDAGKLEVLFCTVFPLHTAQAGAFPIKLDLSGESTRSTRLACKNAASDTIRLPPSRRTARYPFSLSEEREAAPFSYLQYDIEQVADHQFVAIIDKATVPTPGFVVAEFSDNDQSHRTRHSSLHRLFYPGLAFSLHASRPMVTEVNLPSVQSSMLAYHLSIEGQSCDRHPELFAPLVRQYLSEPFESKFYVNASDVGVSLHGIAPYMPPPLAKNPTREDGLSLQFWTDPTCQSRIDVRLTLDLLGSMGKLYMRYRTVFAAFPILIVALVLQKQFKEYDETGVFISFSESLDKCLRRSIPVVLTSLTLLSLSVGGSRAAPTTSGLWPWRNSTEALDFHRNDLLTGTQDPVFWFMTPLIGVVCIAVCTALNYATLALTHILGRLFSLAMSRPGWTRHARRRTPQQQMAHESSVPLQSQPLQQLQQIQTQAYFSPPFIQSSPRRRVVTTMILLLLVTTFIPYQFAYLVACLIQIATTVRAQRVASELRSKINYNFYNYVHSILVLMLWILPINLPTLAVWVRNLAVHWLTPFSSHHNLLSIMPFIVLVETLTTGKMVPAVTTRLRHVTSLLFFGVGICAAVYGVSFAYMIHHLVNLLVAWLVIVHSTGEPDTWSVALIRNVIGLGDSDGKRGKTP